MKYKSWILVSRPVDKSLVDYNEIISEKEGNPGKEPFRFKARLIAKEFTQKNGLDYNKIFSPIIEYTIIRVMLALVAH